MRIKSPRYKYWKKKQNAKNLVRRTKKKNYNNSVRKKKIKSNKENQYTFFFS